MDGEKFLVAENKSEEVLIFGSGSRDKKDLVLQPWQPSVVDQTWKRVPHFARAVNLGKVVLSESEQPPSGDELKINQEYHEILEPNQVALVYGICRAEELTDQMLSAIKLSDNLTSQGIPKKNFERVTKNYLKNKHVLFLRATVELEGRFRNRKKVVNLISKEIGRIEAL